MLQSYVLAFMDLVSRLSMSPKGKVLSFITKTLMIDHRLLVTLATDQAKNDGVRQYCMMIFDNLFLAFRSTQSLFCKYLNNDILLCFTIARLPPREAVVEDSVSKEEKQKYLFYIQQQWRGHFSINKKQLKQQMNLFIQVVDSTINLMRYKHLSSSSIHQVTKGIKHCLIGFDNDLYK